MKDISFDNIYKVDQLTAMRYVQTIWDSIPADLMRNCWINMKLTTSERVPGVENHDENIVADVKEVVTSLLPSTECASLTISALVCLLTPAEE